MTRLGLDPKEKGAVTSAAPSVRTAVRALTRSAPCLICAVGQYQGRLEAHSSRLSPLGYATRSPGTSGAFFVSSCSREALTTKKSPAGRRGWAKCDCGARAMPPTKRDRMVAGGRQTDVVRVRVTDAGRQALARMSK